MSQFRDYLNEARNKSVSSEFKIALGQLKRMYNKDETPDLSELEKDAEMIAKKNKLDVNKFLELAKSEFKINESSIADKVNKRHSDSKKLVLELAKSKESKAYIKYLDSLNLTNFEVSLLTTEIASQVVK